MRDGIACKEDVFKCRTMSLFKVLTRNRIRNKRQRWGFRLMIIRVL